MESQERVYFGEKPDSAEKGGPVDYKRIALSSKD